MRVVWIGHDRARQLRMLLLEIAGDTQGRMSTSRHARLAAARIAPSASPEDLAQVALVLVVAAETGEVSAARRKEACAWAVELEGWLAPAGGSDRRSEATGSS